MENASKALIIAGAILLAILLIALGVYVFQSASANTGTEQLSSTEIQSHNDPFSRYEGTVSGTEARALLDTIRTNNINYPDARITCVTPGGTVEDPDGNGFSTAKANLTPSGSYTVTIDDYYEGGEYNGYISGMRID